MSLLKLAIIVTTAHFYNQSFIPPKLPIPVTSNEQKRVIAAQESISWYERIVIPVCTMTRILYMWASVVEASIILAQRFSTYPLSVQVLDMLNAASASTSITATFSLGAFLIIAGALIRFRCFREMGLHFTFVLSIRDNHSLITTGPYSVVRHPAYTAGIMTIVGVFLTMLGDGSWWLGKGSSTTIGNAWAVIFIISTLLIIPAFLRGAHEDSYLVKQFPLQWEKWAQDVPCRYIPGLV